MWVCLVFQGVCHIHMRSVRQVFQYAMNPANKCGALGLVFMEPRPAFFWPRQGVQYFKVVVVCTVSII